MILQAYTGGGKLATQKENSCYWLKPLRRTLVGMQVVVHFLLLYYTSFNSVEKDGRNRNVKLSLIIPQFLLYVVKEYTFGMHMKPNSCTTIVR